eukprot:6213627-Pleurochrysis_carterae.AAC.3
MARACNTFRSSKALKLTLPATHQRLPTFTPGMAMISSLNTPVDSGLNATACAHRGRRSEAVSGSCGDAAAHSYEGRRSRT